MQPSTLTTSSSTWTTSTWPVSRSCGAFGSVVLPFVPSICSSLSPTPCAFFAVAHPSQSSKASPRNRHPRLGFGDRRSRALQQLRHQVTPRCQTSEQRRRLQQPSYPPLRCPHQHRHPYRHQLQHQLQHQLRSQPDAGRRCRRLPPLEAPRPLRLCLLWLWQPQPPLVAILMVANSATERSQCRA